MRPHLFIVVLIAVPLVVPPESTVKTSPPVSGRKLLVTPAETVKLVIL
ncbi:MAG: hypothetical protein M0Z28_32030 [Rhodospirillales bacterium]|nr:hypothetical protein [Rhodospirillales bacterium]